MPITTALLSPGFLQIFLLKKRLEVAFLEQLSVSWNSITSLF